MGSHCALAQTQFTYLLWDFIIAHDPGLGLGGPYPIVTSYCLMSVLGLGYVGMEVWECVRVYLLGLRCGSVCVMSVCVYVSV